MKISTLKFPPKLEPFKGVILFMVVMMLSNFFWKYNMIGDESKDPDSMVSFWGMNVSAPFVWMAHHVSTMCYLILNFLGWNITLEPINIIRHATGNSVQIIWACTGLKQAYIGLCILLFARGPWIKKLWYIPLSLLIIYVFNIFRISFIVACVENHPNWFHFLHLYAFKYVFYGIIFLQWMFWEEKIVGKKLEEKA